MSFKYAAKKLREGVYELPAVGNMTVPVKVFMTDPLYELSEEEMWKQVANAGSLEGVFGACVSADGHFGFGVPIGSTVVSETHLYPTCAGYDINCGMMLLETNLHVSQIASKEIRRALISEICDHVPSGVGTHRANKQRKLLSTEIDEIIHYGAEALERKPTYHERNYIRVEKEYPFPPRVEDKRHAIGSLGGGNHFEEIQVDQNGKVYVMLHTGSRGFGWNIANYFFKMAKQLKVNRDLLAFPFDSELGQEYWNLHNMAANFALGNRTLIGQGIAAAFAEVIPGAEVTPLYEISHNLVQKENGRFVHRKGATRAFPGLLMAGTPWEKTGHPIITPGSMAAGAAILYALPGAAESFYSINHGAGRLLGRNAAAELCDKKQVGWSQEELNAWMENIVQEFDGVKVESILINNRNVPADESKECYKNLEMILEAVETAGLAKVAVRLFPVAVIKGED